MAKATNITIECLRQLLSYCPDTGILTWKVRSQDLFGGGKNLTWWNNKFSGKTAGHFDKNGYVVISIFDRPYLGHRIAWAMYHGSWPEQYIDHVDGNPRNNKISNLREANFSENSRNYKKPKSNTCGFKGASFDASRNKWQARIRVNYKLIHLGRFDTAKEAHDAYMGAAEKYHGAFARFE